MNLRPDVSLEVLNELEVAVLKMLINLKISVKKLPIYTTEFDANLLRKRMNSDIDKLDKRLTWIKYLKDNKLYTT